MQLRSGTVVPLTPKNDADVNAYLWPLIDEFKEIRTAFSSSDPMPFVQFRECLQLLHQIYTYILANHSKMSMRFTIAMVKIKTVELTRDIRYHLRHISPSLTTDDLETIHNVLALLENVRCSINPELEEIERRRVFETCLKNSSIVSRWCAETFPHRFRILSENADGSLSGIVLDELTIVGKQKRKEDDTDSCCAVCLNCDAQVMAKYCGHSFCRECIQTWIGVKLTNYPTSVRHNMAIDVACPCCRHPLEEFYELEL